MEIAGGLYREVCEVPTWDAQLGSGGRAATAVCAISPGSILHTYSPLGFDCGAEALRALGIDVRAHPSSVGIAFAYFHPTFSAALGASQLFPLASSLPWIGKGGTLNRPAEALVAIPDPGRLYSFPVGGIIPLRRATSSRYDGRLGQESASALSGNMLPRPVPIAISRQPPPRCAFVDRGWHQHRTRHCLATMMLALVRPCC